MKNRKRILVTLIACLLLMTTFLPWASAEIIFLPQSSVLIFNYYVNISTSGGGKIDTTALIECEQSVDSLGFSYIRLQELRNGTWTTVKSVTSKYAYNASRYMYTFTYYGTPGVSYRAQAGFYAADSGITETRTDTSDVKTCY